VNLRLLFWSKGTVTASEFPIVFIDWEEIPFGAGMRIRPDKKPTTPFLALTFKRELE